MADGKVVFDIRADASQATAAVKNVSAETKKLDSASTRAGENITDQARAIAEAYRTIQKEVDKAARTMSKQGGAQGAASGGTGGGAMAALSSKAVAMGNILASAVTKVAGKLSELGSSLFDLAATAQKAKAEMAGSIIGSGGTQDDVDFIHSSNRKFAAQTGIASTAELDSRVADLVKAGADVKTAVTVAQQAKLHGNSADGLIQAFIKASATGGTVDSRFVKSMAGGGVDITQGLADRYGISLEKAAELLKSGAVSVEMAAEALQAGSKADVQGVQAMGSTYEGTVSKLKSQFEGMAEDVMTPLLTRLAELLDNLAPLMERAAGTLAGLVGDAVDAFDNVWQGVKQALQPLVDFVSTYFATHMETAKETFGGIIALLKGLFSALAPVFDLLLSALTPIGDIIQRILSPALKLLGAALEAIGTVLQKLVNCIKSALADLLDSLPDFIRPDGWAKSLRAGVHGTKATKATKQEVPEMAKQRTSDAELQRQLAEAEQRRADAQKAEEEKLRIAEETKKAALDVQRGELELAERIAAARREGNETEARRLERDKAIEQATRSFVKAGFTDAEAASMAERQQAIKDKDFAKKQADSIEAFRKQNDLEYVMQEAELRGDGSWKERLAMAQQYNKRLADGVAAGLTEREAAGLARRMLAQAVEGENAKNSKATDPGILRQSNLSGNRTYEWYSNPAKETNLRLSDILNVAKEISGKMTVGSLAAVLS